MSGIRRNTEEVRKEPYQPDWRGEVAQVHVNRTNAELDLMMHGTAPAQPTLMSICENARENLSYASDAKGRIRDLLGQLNGESGEDAVPSSVPVLPGKLGELSYYLAETSRKLHDIHEALAALDRIVNA